MIVCNDLSKSYRGAKALNSITLEIGPGICALLGSNGAGKSTLLKLLTGLTIPDSGQILLQGINIASRPMDVRKLIGVLPEDLGLFDDLNIEEHLELVGPIYGLTRDETRVRAESLLRLLNVYTTRKTSLRECSYGMRKKTALALALLHKPRVVFLDEPFEGIDPLSSKVIEQVLSSLAKRGATILFTSHILPLVERIASRVLILRQGSVAWDSSEGLAPGTLDALYFSVVGQPSVEEVSWLAS
jgi:ABC-2 type transport system ATP-binding protein